MIFDFNNECNLNPKVWIQYTHIICWSIYYLFTIKKTNRHTWRIAGIFRVFDSVKPTRGWIMFFWLMQRNRHLRTWSHTPSNRQYKAHRYVWMRHHRSELVPNKFPPPPPSKRICNSGETLTTKMKGFSMNKSRGVSGGCHRQREQLHSSGGIRKKRTETKQALRRFARAETRSWMKKRSESSLRF